MSRRIPIKALALLSGLGLLTYVVIQSDEVSRAQTTGFDRMLYANDKPVGALESQDELPDTGEFNVMIELLDAPTSRVYAEALGNQSDRAANPPQRAVAQGAARAQMARIRGAQQRVLARLDSFGRSARVLYSVQTAYNGIAARIDAGILPQLRSHADVKGVYALPVHYIENSTSLPFIKAASAWTATGGNAGDGVRIAVIDTGVDYDPSLGFVSGGGQLIHNGYKASVGVNIKYLKSDKAQGSLLFIEHRPTGDVVVKSNAIGTMAIVGGEAIPTGKATLNGVGNHSFIARVIDNGEPGLTDRFGIRMTSPTGAILVDLTFDPIQLTGGNFSVPKLTGK